MIIRIPFIKLLEINPDFLYRTVYVLCHLIRLLGDMANLRQRCGHVVHY